jgi:1,2-diacylglycerol 3-alpha-glucosyltransferase
MKIVQICLCGSYNPKMGYQDNILPKYYVRLGYECVTIASQYFRDKDTIVQDKEHRIILENKSELIRIPNKYRLPYKWNRITRLYSGLYGILVKEKPDIIFLHNFQFLSVYDVIRYCKENENVKVFADSHTDYVNSATNWLSKNILHKIVWRHLAKKLEPYVIKFWGVTEQRCIFLKDVYKIPYKKVDLLVMGADDDKINFKESSVIRNKIRESLSITKGDFMIITGGKIDKKKNIHSLLEAVNEITCTDIKLVLFGDISKEMGSVIDIMLQNPRVKFIGWVDADRVYDYFLASDLGVFPGTHSVLWEQAVGTGLPCIFKDWDGMHHLDVGGNCIFIDKTDKNNIKENILNIYKDKEKYENMERIAKLEGVNKFSYYQIAKKSINES